MALAPLLYSDAVIDLCGGDLVLPSFEPSLREEASVVGAVAQRVFRRIGLRSAFRKQTGEVRENAQAVSDLLRDPKKAVQDKFQEEVVKAATDQAMAMVDKAADSLRDRFGSAVVSIAEDDLAPDENLGNSPSLAKMTEALSLGSSILGRWASEEGAHSSVQNIAEVLEECYQTARKLPRPLTEEELPGLMVGRRSPKDFSSE
jgi:hypothetical protein